MDEILLCCEFVMLNIVSLLVLEREDVVQRTIISNFCLNALNSSSDSFRSPMNNTCGLDISIKAYE